MKRLSFEECSDDLLEPYNLDQFVELRTLFHANDEYINHLESEIKSLRKAYCGEDIIIKDLEKQNEILMEAVRHYADPYNYTPDRKKMHGNRLNFIAWEALEKIKEMG